MADVLSLAADNLLSPLILFFVLGVLAAFARSDLTIPEAAAKALSIYLLFAIGFKGGASVAAHGVDFGLVTSLVAGGILSALIPFVAFALLKIMTKLSTTDAAAVAGHYGSISIVTFVACSTALTSRGLDPEGYMVAVAAVMEAPAILSALWLVSRGAGGTKMDSDLWREILLNGSIVLLVGSFAIGAITGQEGLDKIALATGLLLGLSAGGVALFMTLCASASYIAVPAAMRVALPEANPSIYLTLSLGITFPFNLTLGIPAYIAVATQMTGG